MGVGRDDGLEAGENSPICTYFRNPVFPLLDNVLSLEIHIGKLHSRNMFFRLVIPSQVGDTDGELECSV